MSFLEFLLPAGLEPLNALALVTTSFVTATMTAALGVGGGVLLLAVTASLLPPLAIIPVHGLVQTGANSHRALMTRRHLDRRVLADFALGALAGAVLATLVVIRLPPAMIQLSVGLFVLWLLWGPGLPKRALGGWGLRLAAAATTLISMLVGASGPLVAAFVQQISNDRYVKVATFSACMAIQHGLKLVVFAVAGFAFGDWLGLVAAMILSGSLGTLIGLRLLRHVPNRRFGQIFRLLVTLLALRLLWSGLSALA